MSARTFRQRVEEARSRVQGEIARRAQEAARVRGFDSASELVELAREDESLRDELRREILGVEDREAVEVGRELQARQERAFHGARAAAREFGLAESPLLSTDRERLLERVGSGAFAADPVVAGRRALIDWLGERDPEKLADLQMSGKVSDAEFSAYLSGAVPEPELAPVAEGKPLEEMSVEELEQALDAQIEEGRRR